VSEGEGRGGSEGVKLAKEEALNLEQHVHLALLKKKLWNNPLNTISYEELLQLCQTVGMASDNDVGVVIAFQDKVHLHPKKVR
jgi:hypothetical protein